MKRAFLIVPVLAAIAAAVSPAASAAQYGLYAGGAYAQAESHAERAPIAELVAAIYQDFSFTPLDSTTSFDAKDAAFGFVVGFRLHDHWALEGGYLDLGELSYRDQSTGLFDGSEPESWVQNVDADTSGILLSGLGILPLSYRFEVYARLGFLISSSELSLFISDGIGSRRGRSNKSGFDPLAGLGMSLSFAEIYALRLEVMRVFDAGDEDTFSQGDVDLLNLGITVAF